MTSPVDRDSTGPSNNRTIPGAIAKLFRAAVATITGRDQDEPQPEARRRRSGETEGQFRRLARHLWRRCDARQNFRLWSGITSRYVPIDPGAHAVATEYLESTLDALNQMNDDPGSDYGGDFNAIPNFNSHLQL